MARIAIKKRERRKIKIGKNVREQKKKKEREREREKTIKKTLWAQTDQKLQESSRMSLSPHHRAHGYSKSASGHEKRKQVLFRKLKFYSVALREKKKQ